MVTGNLRRTNYTTRFYCAVINSLLVKYRLNKAEMTAVDPGICNGGGVSRISVWWGHVASAVARAYNVSLGGS